MLQDKWTPLAAAANKCPGGAAAVVRLLLDNSVDINTPSQVARMRSASGGGCSRCLATEDCCSRCFSSRAHCVHVCCLLSQGGRTPLHHAAAGNHYDVVRMLLECKAEVNTRDEVRAWIGNIHVQGSADDARLEVGRQEWDDGDSCKGVSKQSCPCFRTLGNLFCRFLERED